MVSCVCVCVCVNNRVFKINKYNNNSMVYGKKRDIYKIVGNTYNIYIYRIMNILVLIVFECFYSLEFFCVEYGFSRFLRIGSR